jgi:hypothetical protein
METGVLADWVREHREWLHQEHLRFRLQHNADRSRYFLYEAVRARLGEAFIGNLPEEEQINLTDYVMFASFRVDCGVRFPKGGKRLAASATVAHKAKVAMIGVGDDPLEEGQIALALYRKAEEPTKKMIAWAKGQLGIDGVAPFALSPVCPWADNRAIMLALEAAQDGIAGEEALHRHLVGLVRERVIRSQLDLIASLKF